MTTQTALENPIAPFKPHDEKLKEVIQNYGSQVIDVTTTKGMAAAKESRKELRNFYLNLKDAKAEIKRPYLDACQLIEDEYKRIDSAIKSEFNRFDSAIKAEENRKKREKEEKERQEREALAAIQAKVTDLATVKPSLITGASEAVSAEIERIKAIAVTGEEFGDLQVEAQRAKNATLQTLESLLEQRLLMEENARQVAQAQEQMKQQKESQAKAEAITKEQNHGVEKSESEAKEMQKDSAKNATIQHLIGYGMAKQNAEFLLDEIIAGSIPNVKYEVQ